MRSIKGRIEALERAIGVRGDNTPKPSGVVIYRLCDGTERVWETGLKRYFENEAECKEFYKSVGFDEVIVFLPYNKRERLEDL